MEGKGATPIFSSLQKLPVPPQATGVIGPLYGCAFSLYNSGIQSTMVSLLDLNDVILFLQCPFLCVHLKFCKYTLYVMYLTSQCKR